MYCREEYGYNGDDLSGGIADPAASDFFEAIVDAHSDIFNGVNTLFFPVLHADRRIHRLFCGNDHLSIYDGSGSAGAMEVSAVDLSAMPGLYSHGVPDLMVDPIQKQADHMACGNGSDPWNIRGIIG